MMFDERIEYNRRSIRMQKFDYGRSGYYFVTICVQYHQCVFGEIIDGCVNLNDTGLLVQSLWERLPLLGAIMRDFKGAATYEIHKKGVVEFA